MSQVSSESVRCLVAAFTRKHWAAHGKDRLSHFIACGQVKTGDLCLMREAGSRLDLHLRVSGPLRPWKAGTGVRTTESEPRPLGQKLEGQGGP